MEIHIFGEAADRAIAHLEGHAELISALGENRELFTSDPCEVSARMRGIAATFCQILAFDLLNGLAQPPSIKSTPIRRSLEHASSRIHRDHDAREKGHDAALATGLWQRLSL